MNNTPLVQTVSPVEYFLNYNMTILIITRHLGITAFHACVNAAIGSS